jgi:acetylornithine aminotransferase
VAAALAVLDTIRDDRLLDHVDALGKHLATSIEGLGHPMVAGVRGRGLLLGVALTQPIAVDAQKAATARGFIVNAPATDVIRLAPPLVLTVEQADRFVAALPDILDTASAGVAHTER